MALHQTPMEVMYDMDTFYWLELPDVVLAAVEAVAHLGGDTGPRHPHACVKSVTQHGVHMYMFVIKYTLITHY